MKNPVMQRSSYQGVFPTAEAVQTSQPVPDYFLPQSAQVHDSIAPRVRARPEQSSHNSFPTHELPKAKSSVPDYVIPADSFSHNPRYHARPGGNAAQHNSYPTREAPSLKQPVEYVLPEGYDDASLQRLPTLSSKRKPFRRKSNSGKGERGAGRNTEWQTSQMAESQHTSCKPTKHPLDHMNQLSHSERKRTYDDALKKTGPDGVAGVLQAVREKVNQKMRGGLAQLQQAFHFFDQEQSATVDLPKFAGAIEAFGLQFPEHQLVAVFATYDRSLSGSISYDEFLKGMQNVSASTRRPSASGPSLMPWEGTEAAVKSKKQEQSLRADNRPLHRPQQVQHKQVAPLQSSQQENQTGRTLRFDKKTRTYTLRESGASGLL